MEKIPKQDSFLTKLKPLTKGLGFHCESSSSQILPPSKKNLFKGKGAISGGPVQFSPSITAAISTVHNPPIPPLPKQPTKAWAGPKTLKETSSFFDTIYLTKRFFGFLLDITWITTIGALGFAFVLFQLGFSFQILEDPIFLKTSVFFLIALNASLLILEETLFKTSLGKKYFDLYLESSGVRIFFRALFFFLTLGGLGIGLLMAFFHPKKSTWIDRIFRLQPNEIPRS